MEKEKLVRPDCDGEIYGTTQTKATAYPIQFPVQVHGNFTSNHMVNVTKYAEKVDVFL